MKNSILTMNGEKTIAIVAHDNKKLDFSAIHQTNAAPIPRISGARARSGYSSIRQTREDSGGRVPVR